VTADPKWPDLLIACVKDHAAGARTFPEFKQHQARKSDLIRAVGLYAKAKGWPLLLIGDYEVGPGAGLWCDFLFGVEDPAFLGDAMLQLDEA
jgi:hypothetical protein